LWRGNGPLKNNAQARSVVVRKRGVMGGGLGYLSQVMGASPGEGYWKASLKGQRARGDKNKWGEGKKGYRRGMGKGHYSRNYKIKRRKLRAERRKEFELNRIGSSK